jgi:SnoaL-like protein
MADLTSEARGAVEAFNNADWDGARKYFADSTYTEFGTQRSVSGFDALLELMQGWKAAMPDVRGTVTGAAAEGQPVALEIMWKEPRPVSWSPGRAPSRLRGTGRGRLPCGSSTTRAGSSGRAGITSTCLPSSGRSEPRNYGRSWQPACKPGSVLTVVSGAHLPLFGCTPR